MVIRKEKNENVSVVRDRIIETGPETLFSHNELEKFFNGRDYHRLAARYLAKTIIVEEFADQITMTDFQIETDDFGRPQALFNEGISASFFQKNSLKQILVSLTHSGDFARALVIFEYL